MMDSDLNSDATNAGATPVNTEELMQLGIQAARQGHKQNAQMIFRQVLATDRQNERAWMWMAATADTPTERAKYLRTVLQINPQNTRAKNELDQMLKKRATSNSQALTYGLIGLSIVVVFIILAILAIAVT